MAGRKQHGAKMGTNKAPPAEIPGSARGRTGLAPDGGLRALIQPALDPAFWQPEPLGSADAWSRHAPFAHWIVANAAPRIIVDLGPRPDVSYAAFCRAVALGGVDAHCFAVGAWRDDPQAAERGGGALEEFRSFHDARFGGFSVLLRCGSDDALGRFADGSIDLLHLDGLRCRDAVRHVFEGWKRKLSGRGVVLLHGIGVRTDGFGAWRLWAELRRAHPGFEFPNGRGLGVLAFGECVSPAVAGLCAFDDPAEIEAVRRRFDALGERRFNASCERVPDSVADRAAAAAELARAEARAEALEQAHHRLRLEAAMRLRAAARTAEARREASDARARVERAEAAANAASMAFADLDARRVAESAALAAEADALQAALRERERMRAAAAQDADELRAALRQTAAERDAVLRSAVWRATAPLRGVGKRTPPGFRRVLRAGAKLGWWSLTMRLPRKLRGRRAPAAEALPGEPSAPAPQAGPRQGASPTPPPAHRG